MKKALSLVLALAIGVSLAGCGSKPAEKDTDSPTEAPAATEEAKAADEEASEPPAAEGKTYDQTWTIKLAMTQGDMDREESAEIMYAELFKEYVEANSGGAVKVDIYPSGQLGSAAENVQGIVANNVEMAIVNMTLLNSIYEDSMLLSCPGLFSSEEECDAILNGEWGKSFFADMEAATGVKMLTAISNGFRCFTTSNKELTTVDTAKGVTWRVMESPVCIKMVEALGANPVPMAGSEMYTAMQNGTVDGQENPPVNILNDKTYEVQKYMVLDKHMASIVTFVISSKFMDTLPQELQKVIYDGANAAMPEAQRVVKKVNDEGVDKLREYGMSVYEPTEEELAAWHEKIAGPCQDYVRGELGDEVVDNLLTAIETVRK